MLFSSIFKWLNLLTADLFVTKQSPIFMVVNQTDNEDYYNHVCRILCFLGANVVNLTDLYKQDLFCHNCFDGIICINKKLKKIEIELIKAKKTSSKKTYKKMFLEKNFFQ